MAASFLRPESNVSTLRQGDPTWIAVTHQRQPCAAVFQPSNRRNVFGSVRWEAFPTSAKKEGGTLPTLEDHEAVLRSKCSNGRLYRRGDKLAAWLAIPESEVEDVLDRLVSLGVLCRAGTSSKGSEIFQLGLPSHLSDDARRLYRVMLENTSASDVVNFTSWGQLARAADMTDSQVQKAYFELERAELIATETFGDRKMAVLLKRLEVTVPPPKPKPELAADLWEPIPPG